MLAEQCIGNTLRWGSRKFITPKIDFFISPAYCVPPMMTSLRVKFTMTKTSELVPSRLGSARKPGALTMVNSGLWFFNSSAVGPDEKLAHKQVVPGILVDHLDGQLVFRIGAAEQVLTRRFLCPQVLQHPLVERVELLGRKGEIHRTPVHLVFGDGVLHRELILGRAAGALAGFGNQRATRSSIPLRRFRLRSRQVVGWTGCDERSSAPAARLVPDAR